ncbi:MAG: hypothetical protein K6V97_02840 [Actinomycetia bacterium]|nr:hypothetical protein [Actinomycetes bacterium]
MSASLSQATKPVTYLLVAGAEVDGPTRAAARWIRHVAEGRPDVRVVILHRRPSTAAVTGPGSAWPAVDVPLGVLEQNTAERVRRELLPELGVDPARVESILGGEGRLDEEVEWALLAAGPVDAVVVGEPTRGTGWRWRRALARVVHTVPVVTVAEEAVATPLPQAG